MGTDIFTFPGFLKTLEVPREGTSAIPEKALLPAPEAFDPSSQLTVCFEFTFACCLHFVLCPDCQCVLWHFDELEDQ